MNAKARFLEWALWRLEPSFSIPTRSTPLQRIRDDQENAGASTGGFHYDMLGPTEDDPETVAGMPDGGMADIVERMAGAIDHDNRCREIDRLVCEMRARARDYWNLVDVTFSGTHPRDIMRGSHTAAAALGIGEGEYRTRMRAIYEWAESRLGISRTKGSKSQDKRYAYSVR